VNAWCMAGGRMAVYTGLLQKVDPTDDELAQVMGHEISHALANHTAERMSVALATSAGLAVAGAVAGNDHSAALGATALAAQLAIQLPNSRAAESEADRIGIELAAKAGYDPNAAASLWTKMGQVSGGGPPQWMMTAYMLGVWTAQREGDILRLARARYDGAGFTIRQGRPEAKRGKGRTQRTLPSWRVRQMASLSLASANT